jgi:hypothetical protein
LDDRLCLVMIAVSKEPKKSAPRFWEVYKWLALRDLGVIAQLLSHAGDKCFRINSLQVLLDHRLGGLNAVNGAILNHLCSLAPATLQCDDTWHT